MSWSKHPALKKNKNRHRRSDRLSAIRNLHVESLEARRLLAADLVGVSPEGVTAVDSNLVLTFSDPVQAGPGTGNIVIRNAADDSVVEIVNINSDRVTFDGATVTVDPVNDLQENANFYVQVDSAAVRDTSADVGNATLLDEDFEGLPLLDSPLASDDVILDINDYVVIMSGTLNVTVAGDYTFGANSDDGQWLAIDVAQDGFDLLDDEVIFDNTTHGNQDRLTVCGLDFAGQSCEGDSAEDPINLDVGEYAFEYWYFERGGGSSGEFYYAPGLHEVFDPASFVLVGDDSQGIGVTADGITATTYKAATDQIGNLDVAFDLVDGFLDSAPDFPASETIPTADVWNTGGFGRFNDNHPLPGFPPPTEGDDGDWSEELPLGFTRDNSQLTEGGQPEFNGWSMLDKQFWINQQGNQDRITFSRGENIVAVTDPDAFDDFVEIDTDPPGFNAFLLTPEIPIDGTVANSLTLEFDSSFRPEGSQTGLVEVRFNGGEWVNLLTLDTDSTPGGESSLERANEHVELSAENPDGGTVQFRWGMVEAGNNWWWAIDNIEVKADVVGNSFAGIGDTETFTFNTFAAPLLSFSQDEVSVDEDAGEVTLTVTREGDTSAEVGASFATSNGTARGADFAAASGTITFAAGVTEQTITIGINEDTNAEADETFTVALSNPSGGAVVGEAATVRIIDNDRPVIVFQEGVEITIDGVGAGVTYEGTTDADPREASPDEFRDGPEINPDGEDGGGEIHALTAFKDLFGDGPGQIPLDAIISKATLTLNITNPGTDIQVHRLLGDFVEEDVTWNDLTLNGNDEPGLQGDGVEATPALRTFSADPAQVQDVDMTEDLQLWLSGEAENFGWGFTPTGTNGVDWDSSEATDPSVRPKLSVEFVVVGDEPSLPGDIDGNGEVAFADFLILSANFNQDVEPDTNGDLDGNGTVNFADFLILSANFGATLAPTAAASSVDAAMASLAVGDADDDESDEFLDLL